MANSWYVRANGKALGPYAVAQLKQLAAQGKVAGDTPVRKGDEGAWLPAARVQGLFSESSALADAPARSGGSTAVAKAKPKLARAEPLAAKPVVRAAVVKPAVVQAAASMAAGAPAKVLEARQQRRHGNSLPLIVAGVVCVLLLVGGGAVAAIAMLASPPEDDAEQVAAAEPFDDSTATPAATAPAETDPVSEGRASRELSEATSASPESAAPASPEEAIAKVKSWKPAVATNGALAGVKVGKLQMMYGMAWLGVDEVRDATGPELVSPGSRPKFLFVRLTVKNNGADQPLSFAGFSGAGGGQEAILADDAGRLLPLSPSAQASAERPADGAIQPRGSITEVLTFRLADDQFEHFKLALPFPKLGYYGLQIERASLAKPGQPSDAGELIVPTPHGHDPVLGNFPTTPEADEPPARATPAGPKEDPPAQPNKEIPDGDSPEAYDELQRSIKDNAGEQTEQTEPTEQTPD